MENKNKYNTSTEDDSLDQTSVNEIDDNTTTEPIDPAVDEITKLKKELDEQKDKYLRLVAEFDNFKRRNAKERMELIQTAGRDVISDLLEIIDDYERAEKQL